MSLHLLVRGASQEMDFETGALTNYLVLQIPDGRLVRAAVDDDVAQAIIGIVSGDSPQPPPDLSPEVPVDNTEMRVESGEGGLVMSFGGEEEPNRSVPTRRLPDHLVDDMGNIRGLPSDPGEIVEDDEDDGTESI